MDRLAVRVQTAAADDIDLQLMITVQIDSPPPQYSSASLTRGSHSLSPPTAASRPPLTPPTAAATPPAAAVASSARCRGRRSLPAAVLTPSLTSSWETFNDDGLSKSSTGALSTSRDVSTLLPSTTAAAATAADCKPSSVTADDVCLLAAVMC